MQISGLAVPFNDFSTPLTQDGIFYKEVVRPEAFRDTVFNDVRLLVEHNDENILARQSANSLQLFITEKGLEFVAELDENDDYTKSIIDKIDKGLLKGVSIQFLSKAPIRNVAGNYERVVDEIIMMNELSLVSNPAYSTTYIEKGKVVNATRAVDYSTQKIQIEEKKEMAEDIKKEPVTNDPETVEEIKEEIEETKEDIKETESEKEVAEEKADDAKVAKLEEQITALTEQLKHLEELLKEKEKETQKGEKENMEIKQNNAKNMETEKFMKYLQGAGQVTRDGLKLADGAAIIPSDIITLAKEAPSADVDLTKYINVTKVNTNAGTYPVMANTKEAMHTVAELEKNPELAKPTFKKVDFKVETYRAALQYSQEILDDATQLAQLLSRHVDRVRQNTYNSVIATELKKAGAKTAKGIDGLKDILNVELDAAYTNRVIIASQSFFNMLDKMKDATGRYLLQPDATQKTDGFVLNVPIYVVSDDLIASKGQAKAFIGDAEEFCTLFVRDEFTAQWKDSDVYGQNLQVGTRLDCEVTDTNAGFYVTLQEAGAEKGE